MAKDKSDRARDKEINRKFERQRRKLNRRWMRNAGGGFVLFVAIVIALQFTPYRDIPMDVFQAAKGFIQKLTTGKSAPVERDAKYW